MLCAAGASAQDNAADVDNPGPTGVETPARGPGTMLPADRLSDQDARFVAETALGGKHEIDTSRLAQQKGTTDEIRGFADRMVRDHTRANHELSTLAATKGITIPDNEENGRSASNATEPTISEPAAEGSDSSTYSELSEPQNTSSTDNGTPEEAIFQDEVTDTAASEAPAPPSDEMGDQNDRDQTIDRSLTDVTATEEEAGNLPNAEDVSGELGNSEEQKADLQNSVDQPGTPPSTEDSEGGLQNSTQPAYDADTPGLTSASEPSASADDAAAENYSTDEATPDGLTPDEGNPELSIESPASSDMVIDDSYATGQPDIEMTISDQPDVEPSTTDQPAAEQPTADQPKLNEANDSDDASVPTIENSNTETEPGSVTDSDTAWTNLAASNGETNLLAEERDETQRLNGLSDSSFDQAYVAGQVLDHARTIALFELEAKNGQDADLRAFAERMLPTLREHYQMARQLAGLDSESSDNDSGSD
jgi:predicted outer membrane protein